MNNQALDFNMTQKINCWAFISLFCLQPGIPLTVREEGK